MSNSLRPHGPYSPWNSPGQNTEVGSLSLLQGILPAQGSNPGLPHCRQVLYQLSQKGSPRILEWVAYPFSRGSSQPRNQTRISCIAGGFPELSGKPINCTSINNNNNKARSSNLCPLLIFHPVHLSYFKYGEWWGRKPKSPGSGSGLMPNLSGEENKIHESSRFFHLLKF